MFKKVFVLLVFGFSVLLQINPNGLFTMSGEKQNEGLPSLFSAILNLRTSIRFSIETLAGIHLNTEEIKRRLELQSNETFKGHLDKIGHANEVSESEISYSLDYTSRSLSPRMDENNPAKDIVVCTVALGDEYAKVVGPCLESQRLYCRGRYDYARLTVKPERMNRHPSWYKIPLAYKLLKLGYKRLFYIDADALITNATIPLEPFFEKLREEKKAVHTAEDDDGINMGIFFLNHSSDAIRLLDLIWIHDVGGHRANWEQGAIKDLLNAYEQVRKVLSIAPASQAFNAFPKEREAICRTSQKNTWEPGDFICHFSGISSPERAQLIPRYVVESSIKQPRMNS
jgi:hypothetical protein